MWYVVNQADENSTKIIEEGPITKKRAEAIMRRLQVKFPDRLITIEDNNLWDE